MRVFVLVIVTVLISAQVKAQIFNIQNGTDVTCSGQFEDDGAGGGAYSDTDYTYTICPDNPGDVIQVSFQAFSLQTSANYQNSDFLTIYDGDNTNVLSLGSYTGSSLNGFDITGTVDNVSGCLTFVFNAQTGNTGGFPGWAAIISCTTPCATPTADSQIADPIPDDPMIQSVGVCLNQEVTFEDIGSTAGAGFTLDQYIWNFDDGNLDSLSGSVATHAWDEPGEYVVTLTVEDNNGCQSLNIQPLQVLVSTIPTFATDFTEEICLGNTGWLDGDPIQSETWTALPPVVFSGETFLADGAGFTFDNTIVFDFFEDGAVLENCDDLLQINMNIEHSYLGDLDISIECPNGTQVTLLDFDTNQGGGTFLGEAVDDPDSTTPGTGYDYGWAPNQTNGNLDDDANSMTMEFTNNDGGTENPFGGVVIPGIYEADGNLCDLVGCPLNGGWTLSIQDNLAADDGNIFQWGIDFDPALYPDVTTFTPVIGLEADSSYWEGPHIVSGSTTASGNYIEIAPPDMGAYEYIFYATNNFGCTFDTTITVNVVDSDADLIVTNDPTICIGGEATLEASSPDDDGTFQYIWDQGLGESDQVTVSPGTTTTYSVYLVEPDGCETAPQEVTVSYFDPLSITALSDTTICLNGNVSLNAGSASGGNGNYAYIWTFDGASVGNGANVNHSPPAAGTYCLTLSDGCETPDVQQCFDVSIEQPIPVLMSADMTEDCDPAVFTLVVVNDEADYALAQWEISDGNMAVGSEFIYEPAEPGDYDVTLTLTSAAGCVYVQDFPEYLTSHDSPVASFDADPQPTIVPQTEITFTDLSLGDIIEWEWTFDTLQNLGTSSEQNPVFMFPEQFGGLYPVRLTVTDDNGCSNSVTRIVEVIDVFAVYVPNAFTPNNDGINDVLQVSGSDIDNSRFLFQVYDRWGDLIFESTDINDPWLGEVHSGTHYAMDGMYTWRVVAHSQTSTDKIEQRGTVTILR